MYNFRDGFYDRAGVWIPGMKDAFSFLNIGSESQLVCSEEVAWVHHHHLCSLCF